ncbi:hypothetical protein ACA040_002583 [Xenophilus aerolatus]
MKIASHIAVMANAAMPLKYGKKPSSRANISMYSPKHEINVNGRMATASHCARKGSASNQDRTDLLRSAE